MIRFCNWKIACDVPLLAMQYDNLTRELRVVGNLPEGYNWAVLVQVNRYFDIIALKRTADGAAAVLTAKQLSQSGYYTVQLRGTQEEKVRHTNTIRVAVGRSLSGDEHWPEIPSEFTQIEQRVYEAMNKSLESEAAAAESAKQASLSETEAHNSSEEAAASAKRAEDAAASGGGIDPGEIAGGAEAIATLAECGVLTPAYENGTFYTDADTTVYIL